jgi:hypothetical protein
MKPPDPSELSEGGALYATTPSAGVSITSGGGGGVELRALA